MTTPRSLLRLLPLAALLISLPIAAQGNPAASDAAPAEDAATAALDAPEASAGENGSGRAWSASASNSFGFGLQTDESTSYWYGMLNVSGSWRPMKHVSLSLGTGVYYTVDSRPNDGVLVDGGGFSLSLRHSRLYKDETYTGLTLSGGLILALPFNMRALNSLHYPWPTVGASLALSRRVGPVRVQYGLSLNKFNPSDTIYVSGQCAASQPLETCYEGWQMSWQVSQRLSASWSFLDDFHLSAGFQFVAGRSFAPSTRDPLTSPDYMASLPGNQRDGFAFDLSAGYDTPVDGLGVGLSFSNGGPWRSNGQSIYNPVFDPRLAAMAVDVSYSY